MSSGSGGGGTTTTNTIQRSDPWSGQVPYLQDAFSEARRLYYGTNPQTVNGMQIPDPNATPQYFPGSTVAPLSPETEQALQLQTGRALAGSPAVDAAQAEAQRTLSGDYLAAGNPYLSQVAQSVGDAVRPQVDSRFVASGRYGSPGYAEATARALADAIAPYAFQNYTAERTNMERTASDAPALAQADYTDISALGDVGARRQAQAQALLQDEVNRWNFNQNRDAARLAQYLAMIQGNYGNTTNTSQTVDAQRSDSAATLASLFQGLLGGGKGLLGL
jgi:hypothetical protein